MVVLTNRQYSPTVPKDNKPHNWNKEQPHKATDGRFAKETYARNNPDKVVWVKENPKKR